MLREGREAAEGLAGVFADYFPAASDDDAQELAHATGSLAAEANISSSACHTKEATGGIIVVVSSGLQLLPSTPCKTPRIRIAHLI